MKHLLTILTIFLAAFLKAQTDNTVYQDLSLFKNGFVNTEVAGTLKVYKNSNIHIDIPEKGFGLSLHKVDLLSEDFYVETSSGKVSTNIDGVFYQGKIDNKENSVATVSMFNNEVVCSFSDENGNFEICGERNKPYTMRQISSERDFQVECYTEDYPVYSTSPESPQTGCKTIQVYFEADYKLYQDKGSSVASSVNYITALFNQVATLYANEQINIQISQIKIWDTPDPYTQYTNISNVLAAFQTNLGSNFNGNLAHFLTTRNLGGGIGYVDVLCFKAFAFAASSITTTFQNVPTYSWSVEVVTHEIGHNIGSWHTQSCNWPGGALDNCYPTEGGCPPGPAPVNGGTIMSYCHLTQYGINFANGFGPVPGNYIRSKYNNAPCLAGTGTPPTGLQTTNITSTSATFSWTPVSGALSYTVQYKPISVSTWLSISVGLNTSYTLTGLTSNTQYQWKVKTDCSTYTNPVSFTTGGQVGCNVVITPSVTNITQSSALIFWTPVNGVSIYHLQYKISTSSNWIEVGFIPTNSYNISGLLSNTTYYVRVRPSCNANFGNITQFTTLGTGGTCPAPTGLQTTNITSTSATFSWTPQSFATGYQIQLKFPGSNYFFTIGSVFVNSYVNFYGFDPASTYEWRVKNQCSGWSSSVSFTTPSSLINQPSVVIPNPTNGKFRIDNLTENGILFNSIGKKVLDLNLNGSSVDISNLPSGVYFLKANGLIFKIIKI